jgi:vacuolar-type H+-ATPase subunit B/Vma2
MASFAAALREYSAAQDEYDYLEAHTGLPDELYNKNATRTNDAFDALVATRARSVPELIAKCDAILHMIESARGDLWEPAQVLAAIRRDLAKLQ